MTQTDPGRPRAGSILVIFLAFLLVRGLVQAAPTHELVSSFDVMPQNPGASSLVLGPDGNLWGAAESGGAYGFGAIFKVMADGSGWQPVLSFSGTGAVNKGRNPQGTMVHDGVGWLWGTTQSGGTSNMGTIFKMEVSTGTLTTVVSFTGNGLSEKGSQPVAGLMNDGQGNFWGTTQRGGAQDFGTVFRLNASTGELITVVEFTGNGAVNAGSLPKSKLIADGAGFLWGTTSTGGSMGLGTVFKIEVATGILTTLVEFTGNGAGNRGSQPSGGLVDDGMGNLWGTTTAGGTLNHGTIFKIDISSGALTTVIDFTNNGQMNRGRTPSAGLMRAPSGQLWGTTYNGGGGGVGTVFRLDPVSGVLTTRIDFTYNSGFNKGGYPLSGLTIDGAGMLWGTTRYGGPVGLGTVFRLNPDEIVLSTRVDFTDAVLSKRGRGAYGGLLSDASGSLWGTTANGGATGSGVIYKLEAGAAVPTPMVDFGTSAQVPGGYSYTGLTSDGAGNLWGVTQGGGPSGSGTVFKMNATTGAIETVVIFSGNGPANKGAYPSGALVSDGVGFFWGTTVQGGAGNRGTLFKLNAATGELTTLVEFTGNGATDRGANPYGALASDSQGNFWGSTAGGGMDGFGTIFKFHPGTGVLTTLIDFTNIIGANRGANPWGALVNDGAGSFWGTTQAGGAGDFGTIFKIDENTGTLTTILDFTRTGAVNKGASPSAPLFYDGAGFFWGTTRQGGLNDAGTIFKVEAATGVLTTVLLFNGVGTQAGAGSSPGYGALLRQPDGHLYGVTAGGGPGGGGTIFRLRFGPTPVTEPASSIAYTIATLHGTVNPNGDGDTTVFFEYSTSPTFSGALQTEAIIIPNGNTATPVSAAVTELSASTTYYYRIRAANAGNAVPQVGAPVSFTTLANSTPVVTLVGGNPATIEAALAYADPGATATDEEDGPLTPTLIFNGVLPSMVGTYAVTWQATDEVGSTGSATRTVNVVDTTPPALILPGDVFAAVGATMADEPDGTVVNYPSAIATDIVGVATLTYSHPSGSLFPVGSTNVTVTAQDVSGNLAMGNFTVTVTVSEGMSGWRETHFGVANNIGDAADLADPNRNGIQNLLEYALNGDPTAPPGAPTPKPVLGRSADNRLQLTFPRYLDRTDVNLIVVAADSLAGPWTNLAASNGGSAFQVAASGAGVVETGTGLMRQVTVTDLFPVTDPAHPQRFLRLKVLLTNAAPGVLLIGQDTLTIEASTAYTDPGATAMDLEDGSLTPVISANSVVANVVGSYAVTWQATDASGSVSSATRAVTVVDTTAPELTAPAAIIAEATSAAGAVVNYGAALATDVVGVSSLTYSQPSGSVFALGTTEVTVTAVDAAGNSTSATFNVTVEDTTPPQVVVPGAIFAEAASSAGAAVNYGAAMATDAVGVASLTYSQPSESVFPLGTTTVAVTALDAAGNSATRTFDVTVRDTTPPALTLPGNVIAEATSATGAIVSYGAPLASDLVGVAALNSTPASGSHFPMGTTVVTVTASDGAGNVSSSTFSVLVQDTTAPMVVPPGNVFVNAGGPGGTVVNFPPATATDIVGVTGVSYSQDSGSLFVGGRTVVVVTATDAAGNVGTGSFQVEVNLPPEGGLLSASPTAGLQQGDVVRLSATGWTDVQGPLTYEFFFEGASLGFAAPTSQFDLIAPAPGTYATRVRVTDALGAFIDTDLDLTVFPGVASWRHTYFGTTADEGDAADLSDPNKNGLVNLVEYALNGDPWAPVTTAALVPTLSRSGDNRLQLSFQRYLDRTDLTLSIVAADSVSGPWTELATSVAGAPLVALEPGATVSETGSGAARQVTVTDPFPVTDPAHPQRLLRLKVRR